MNRYKKVVVCPICKEKREIICNSKIKERICRQCTYKNQVKGSLDKNGYVKISQKYQHRIVWEKENGPIPKGYVIHHKDGDRKNNAIENLELLLKIEHDKLTMLKVWKERKEKNIKLNYSKKIKLDIKNIINLLKKGQSLRKIAMLNNISHTTVSSFLKENNINCRTIKGVI